MTPRLRCQLQLQQTVMFPPQNESFQSFFVVLKTNPKEANNQEQHMSSIVYEAYIAL